MLVYTNENNSYNSILTNLEPANFLQRCIYFLFTRQIKTELQTAKLCRLHIIVGK